MSHGETELRRRALAIFDEVADLAGEARARRLDELCGGDDALRAQVQALLDADAAGTDPVSGDAQAWRAALSSATDMAADATGRTVGAWHITGTLGRGGMGAVYAVERADGAYAQRAALKLIRAGTDSPSARERFLRERQVLARLQHPHIASLFDGGFSAEGDPYFVMERVDGMPIDQWCDARRLGLAQRVDLFLQALDAVQYAHRNLVVHRDLKPSNLLVTPDGQVKLLDFGIAKELQGSEATATHDRALTFEYASPEQLHDAPITTATDVWQLGIVLHRLLSGAHPFGLSRDTPLAKQLQLLEREPEPPTRAAAQATPETAALREHSPASLAKALRGDLSHIVQGCLRRAPEQRYPSVEALADDLRRWREHRPLRIAPPSRTEATALWLRRHRAAAVATAMVAAAVLAGAGVALWQAYEAREQARIAERESQSARATLAFLTDTLSAAAPGQAMSTEVSVRQLLDQARSRLEQRELEPRVRQSIQRLLGHLYNALGESDTSARLFEAGLEGVTPGNPDEAVELAADLDGHARALAALERGRDSLATAQRAVALRERFVPLDRRQRFLGTRQLALAYTSLADCKQGDARWKQALDEAAALPAPVAAEVADAYVAYARMLFSCGELPRGAEVADAGIAYADAHAIPPLSPTRANLLWVKASNAGPIGRIGFGESESLLRQAIDIQEKTAGPGGAQMAEFYSTLGAQLQTQAGRMPEALRAHEHAALLFEAAGATPVNQAITQYNIGYLYRDYGDYPKSLAAHERALAILAAAKIDPDHIEYRRAEKWYALALMQSGKPAEARERLLRLRQRALELDGEASMEYVDTVWNLLRAAALMDDLEHGEPLLADVRRRVLKFVPETHHVFTEFLRDDAHFAMLRHDYPRALRLQQEALDRLQAQGSAMQVAVGRMELAWILAAAGDRPRARQVLTQALPVVRDTLQAGDANRVKTERLARTLGM